MAHLRSSANLFALLLATLFPALAPRGQVQLSREFVATGFDRPVGMAAPPDGTGRIMVLEQQSGLIRVLEHGAINPEPFLDLGAELTVVNGEQGLHGLAFHPNFAVNGRFFVQFNGPGGHVLVREYNAAPGASIAAANPVATLFDISKPFDQHNGGSLMFGPDGMLYSSVGDGGSGNDPFQNAQDLGTLLGKVLRVDVDSGFPYSIPPGNPFVGLAGAKPEIYCYGLRNPWRATIDSVTGDLWIADVGQETREEIDWLPNGQAGLNFGWRCLEGTLDTGLCGSPPSAPRAPVYEYDHNEGCAVMGGAVYRGSAIPELQGRYLFSDFCTGRTWSLGMDASGSVDVVEHTSQMGGYVDRISSHGVDQSGEHYLLYYHVGSLFRIVPFTPSTDCDGDGIGDPLELSSGSAFDANSNLLPDDCELLLSVDNLVPGTSAHFSFIGGQPGLPVIFAYSLRGIGEGPCYFGNQLCLDLVPFLIAGQPGIGVLTVLPADPQGQAQFDAFVPLDVATPVKFSFQVVALQGLDFVKSNPVQKTIL